GRRQRGDDLLVLLGREGAHGIDEDTVRPDEGRNAGEDLPLERREAWNVLRPPAPAELGVTAQRAEAAARRVHQHGVERAGEGRSAGSGAAPCSTRGPPGAHGPGVVERPSAASSAWSASLVVTVRLARSAVGARSLLAASSAGSASAPNSSAQRATSQRGCDHSTARRPSGSPAAGGSARPAAPSAAARRRTALTSPLAPAPAVRASRTLASTAA